jgi:uncharacterized membrane protein YoaK (UPF0700 family)
MRKIWELVFLILIAAMVLDMVGAFLRPLVPSIVVVILIIVGLGILGAVARVIYERRRSW